MYILRYRTEVAGIVTTSVIQIFKGVYAKDSDTFNSVFHTLLKLYDINLMYEFSAEAFVKQFFSVLQLSFL